MDLQLQPLTEVGRRFSELADLHAKQAAATADRHDREGSFPTALFDAMGASGFLKATVPSEFGGMGLASAHDLAVGLARLAHGDGSAAIAANMHLSFGLIATRNLQRARDESDEKAATQMSGALVGFGAGAIGAANATEAGTDVRHPLTEATKVDGGWSITGTKIFGTLSPIADLFFVPFRTPHDSGGYSFGSAFVPRGTPGQTILDNWDALGMRASGSSDVVYENCVVPDAFVQLAGPWGEESELGLVIATAGNIGLVGSFLGIAEVARDLVVEMARTRKKSPSNRPIAERHGIQHQVAEMEADLETCRAMIERSGRAIDHHLFTRPPSDVTIDELHRLNAQLQCTKLVVGRKAIEIVDRALTISGGAGYLSAHPLSRLYRDVRAGPFMQPFSPNEAYEYIGKAALGLPLVLEG